MGRFLLKGRWMLSMGLLLSLLAAGQVVLSHQRYEMAKETRVIRHHRQVLLGKINQLGLELASLTRPERIRKLASSRLEMAPPTPLQVIRP